MAEGCEPLLLIPMSPRGVAAQPRTNGNVTAATAPNAVTLRSPMSSYRWEPEDVMLKWLMRRGLAAFEITFEETVAAVHR